MPSFINGMGAVFMVHLMFFFVLITEAFLLLGAVYAFAMAIGYIFKFDEHV